MLARTLLQADLVGGEPLPGLVTSYPPVGVGRGAIRHAAEPFGPAAQLFIGESGRSLEPCLDHARSQGLREREVPPAQ